MSRSSMGSDSDNDIDQEDHGFSRTVPNNSFPLRSRFMENMMQDADLPLPFYSGLQSHFAWMNDRLSEIQTFGPDFAYSSLIEISNALWRATPEEAAQVVPTKHFVTELSDLLKDKDTSNKCLEVILRIFSQILFLSIPDAANCMVMCGVIEVIAERSNDLSYIDIAERGIAVLEGLAEEYPIRVLESKTVNRYVEFLDFFDIHVQKSILNLVNLTTKQVPLENIPSVVALVPLLEAHLHTGDVRLVESATQGMCQLVFIIAKRASDPVGTVQSCITEDIWRFLVVKVNPESSLLAKIVEAIACIAENSPTVSAKLFDEKIYSKVSLALAKVDTRSMKDLDLEAHVETLAGHSKDTLLAGVHFFSSLLPVPFSVFDFKGPYRLDQSRSPVELHNIEDAAKVCINNLIVFWELAAGSGIHRDVLLSVLKFVQYLEPPQLAAVAEHVDLAAFICRIISHWDANIYIVGALDICYELIHKLPNHYLPQLASLGAFVKISELSTDDTPTGLYSDNSNLAPVVGFMAHRITKFFRLSTFYSQKTYASEIETLRSFSTGEVPWDSLINLIRDNSSLELQNIHTFDYLCDFLTSNGNCDEFWKRVDPGFLHVLISKLQDVLSSTERFGLLKASAESNRPSLESLSKLVCLKVKNTETSLSFNIQIQAIAPVRALEASCRRELTLNHVSTISRNILRGLLSHARNGSSISEDEESSEDDEDEIDEIVTHRLPRHTVADLRRALQGVDGLGESDNVGEHEEEDNLVNDLHPQEDSSDHSDMDQIESDDEYDGPAHQQRSSDIHTEQREGIMQGTGSHRVIHHTVTSTIEEEELNATGMSQGIVGFYYKGQRIAKGSSILSALYNATRTDQTSLTELLDNHHEITFEVGDVSDEKEEEEQGNNEGVVDSQSPYEVGGLLPTSLTRDNMRLESILKVLSILSHMNDVSPKVPSSAFINRKLSAKLKRQLDETLLVVAKIYPQWVLDSLRCFPFVYSFDTRYMFMMSTSFGRGRCIHRFQSQSEHDEQNGTRLTINQIPKRRYRVSRETVFTSSLKLLSLSFGAKELIEVEFYKEEGTGLGPTLEFFAIASREFQRVHLNMFRGSTLDGYFYDTNGLFPSPKTPSQFKRGNFEQYFRALGRLLARALQDQRILDIRLNPAFFTLALGLPADDRTLLRSIDPDLEKNVYSLDPETVRSLELDFTLPGYDIALVEDGESVIVDKSSLAAYQRLVTEFTLHKGVYLQIEAFKDGFSDTAPLDILHGFRPNELSMMFGQSDEDWSVQTLKQLIKADHGYCQESRLVNYLIELLATFQVDERRRFLQFLTGSPNLPIGGFRSLSPPFTIVLKHPENDSEAVDVCLPSVMTCANYLKLPEYSTKEVLQKQLWRAIDEGSGSFPLS